MILRAAILGGFVRDYQAADQEEKIARFTPRGIDLDRVHVRSFLAANSRPSKDGMLRIREKAMSRFAKLYPGAPLMRNHGLWSSDDMPVGRVFDAHTRTADDKARELILSAYFLKGDEEGDRMADKIDAGIWSETSIHGAFSVFDCSICGKTLDPSEKNACTEHEPGTEYGGEMARIELDEPTEAPEFSLCWSGRLAGTRALSQHMAGTVTVSQLMEQRSPSWLGQIQTMKRKQEAHTTGGWLDSLLVTAA